MLVALLLAVQDLRGTVALKQAPPKARVARMACPDCAPLYPAGMPIEDLVVDRENRVRSAFVYVKAGLEGKTFQAPKTPVVLEQKGCRYDTRVLALQIGQPLVIRNRDPHEHAVHAYPFRNKEFNFSQGRGGPDVAKHFDRPEVMIKIKDDVRPWMTAWVAALDHPYFAVTAADGTYEIKGLPPGRYTLAVWHERASEATRDVEIPATTIADFALDLK